MEEDIKCPQKEICPFCKEGELIQSHPEEREYICELTGLESSEVNCVLGIKEDRPYSPEEIAKIGKEYIEKEIERLRALEKVAEEYS